MITAWTKHLPEDQKEKFKSEVLGSKRVLNRLQAIINEMKEDADKSELDTRIYEVPNWDYRQADTNGFKRALKLVSKIINLDPEVK